MDAEYLDILSDNLEHSLSLFAPLTGVHISTKVNDLEKVRKQVSQSVLTSSKYFE